MNLNDDDNIEDANLGRFYNTNHIGKTYEPNTDDNTNLKRLNVQLVDKNDKKFIKLNLNNSSNDKLKASTSQAGAYQCFNKINMTELDDLPSESDLSSGMTLIRPTTKNQQAFSSVKTVVPVTADKVISNQAQHKTVAIYYKCNQCRHVFDNESAFKSHQNSLTCMQSMSMKSQDEDSDTNNQQHQQTSPSFKVTKQRSFICNECGKLFQTQASISKHMRQEHNDKPVELKKQHENELQSSSYLSTQLFKCYICSLDFTLATSLRSHLHKVHSKKVDHEFDDVNGHKTASSTHEAPRQGCEAKNLSISNSRKGLDTNNNTVLYIKDPKNKSAEIQHMVVYVDGKPIFVQKPKATNNQGNSVSSEQTNTALKLKTFQKKTTKPSNESEKAPNFSKPKASFSKSAQNSAPVTKIPYLLARAAAAAASSHRQQQNHCMQKYHQFSNQEQSPHVICHGNKSSPKPILSGNTKHAPVSSGIESKHDQEYLQLVSMLRQKNEKLLFNPQVMNRN